MKKRRKVIIIVLIAVFIVSLFGSTFSFWGWVSEENSNVSFVVSNPDLACSADGGEEINDTSISIMPSSCTNSNHALIKEIKVNASFRTDLLSSMYMNLWLNINSLSEGLRQSHNFRYALTTSNNSCTENVIASGNFYNLSEGDRVKILNNKEVTTPLYSDTYYLYIWLDATETDVSTAEQSFDLSLSGECSNVVNMAPNLDDGMIPVTISEDGEVSTVSQFSSEWYDYDNQKWANAVLVTEESRSSYLETTDVTVDQSDILAYYVWIPRFKYRIWTTGLAASGSEQSVDIVFESASEPVSLGNSVSSYRTHPAFWWDVNDNGEIDNNEMLSGFWVGKFETSGSATEPKVLPNVTSLKSQSVSNQFKTSLKFAGGTLTDGVVSFDGSSTYGLTNETDSHMMKNSEWGAVAYLSHSKYGINGEIYKNNSNGYYTGRSSGTTPKSGNSTYGTYTWLGQSVATDGTIGDFAENREVGTNASTTGNVTGIYDMVGGSYDRLMAVLADSNGKPRSGGSTTANSGFNGTTGSSKYTSGIDFPSSRYYDLYTSTSVLTACNGEPCYGHALSETSTSTSEGSYGWYKDYLRFLTTASTWMIRGDYSSSGTNTGTFAFTRNGGTATTTSTFRSVLIKVDNYTISFDANGGTGGPGTQLKYYGSALTLSGIEPQKEGFRFVGWSTDSEATSATYSANGTFSINADTTLYAVWQPAKNLLIGSDVDNITSSCTVDTCPSNTFLGTPLLRNQISTIEFVNNNKVPSSAVNKYDVSLYQDGGIMLWHGNPNSEGLYDVYIGSSDGKVVLSNGYYLFGYLINLRTINFADVIDTSYTTSLASMFYECDALKTLDLSSFDTSNVTNMGYMFAFMTYRDNLLDLSSFDMSNVTYTRGMFEGATGVVNITFNENVNTSNIDSMEYMFFNMPDIAALDLSNFNTSKADNMSYLFSRTPNLASLTLGNGFDATNVTSMKNMFARMGTSDLVVDLSMMADSSLGHSSSKLTDISSMFYEFLGSSVNLDNLDASAVTTMGNLFYTCTNLKYLYMNYFKAPDIFTDVSQLKLTECTALNVVEMSYFDAPELTTMKGMFRDRDDWIDGYFSKVDLNHFNAPKVTDMSYMFYDCEYLDYIDMSDVNAPLVTDMSYMFYKDLDRARSKETLDIDNLNTSNVTNMSYMFYNWDDLASLDVSKFDTSKVTDMSYMFYGCQSLTTLDVSSFDTSKVTDMSYMFAAYKYSSGSYAMKLTSLDVSEFDTSKVTNMSGMFSGCTSLTTLDVSNFNTSSVINMSSMFSGCTSLTTLDVSSFDTSKVTNMRRMFGAADSNSSSGLSASNFMKLNTITLDVNKFNTSKVTDMSYMFYGCGNLTSLNFLSNFDTTKLTNIDYMFAYFSSLNPVDSLELLNPINVTSMNGVFSGYSGSSSLDFSKIDMSKIKNADYLFSYYRSNTPLDLSTLDLSNNPSIKYMFSYYSSEAALDLSKLNLHEITSIYGMFIHYSSTASLDFANFDTSQVTNMSYMFNYYSSTTSLDVSDLNTSNVTNMSDMFSWIGWPNSNAITTIDFTNFDTSKVTNMSSMFAYSTSLTNLDLSSFDTSNVTDVHSMFYDCENLQTIDLRNADFSGITLSSYYNIMFGSIPTDATIYVKDDTQKTWITSKFTTLTGVTIPT